MKKYLLLLLTIVGFGTLTVLADDPTPTPSSTGTLPPGLDPNKVNLSVYQGLPGIQPPTLDLDGRDLSTAALAMLSIAQPATVMPGMPTGPVTPQPFPDNPLAKPTPSPTPKAP